ncbi:NADPH-dependent F420 reductase [Herpetosiphon giganteus]|uniref:NADPH-dependent F420 reductase n=1 Tax=Herpetosiphon giganteus TaxID=2029754 RepID=UPI00195F0D5F|nr:NAD(P)-binding domain-containing protein [Herpetosiphon giganteus]MBM7846703.1 putative dinucleotide-binding enzyme [Herpetosiphon giganteus]
MLIGVLGAGKVGQLFCELLVEQGHTVLLANSRGPASLQPLIEQLGPQVTAVTPSELQRAEMIILVVRWQHIPAALEPLADYQGIVVDVINNRFGPKPADFYDLAGRGSSEIVAELLPQARLVKAFNHQPFADLAHLQATPTPKALFVAGDDQAAKQVVIALIESLGATAMDLGNLREGGRLFSTGTGPLAGHGRVLSVAEAEAILAQTA